MGALKIHLPRASLLRTSLINHPQVRTVAAFRNSKPGEGQRDALGIVDTPRQKSRANDGTVSWTKLHTGEKVVRSAQQSFNFLVIIAGAALTIGIGSIMYTEVFSPSSKTAIFNRAVTRIRASRECIEALCGNMGSGGDIKAYGESSTWNKWNRNRPLASREETDRAGHEHLHMHFHAEGTRAEGVVQVHMTRLKGESEWEYQLLALDMPGRQRIFLENAEKMGVDKKGGKMFGVKWW